MSTSEKRYVEKVLNIYSEKKETKLDELKQLDKKAKHWSALWEGMQTGISCEAHHYADEWNLRI